jgi:hypothetical protein
MNKTALTASAFLGLLGGAFVGQSPNVQAQCFDHVSASTSTCSTCSSGSGSDDCYVSDNCSVRVPGGPPIVTSCCWDQGDYCY